MNFLAHSHLSGNDKNLMIGNFIADAVKGKKYKDFPQGISKGIILHRKIDYFTDKHMLVRESMNLIRPVYAKFSGIIVDIYYDHFLAANWYDYSSENFDDYVHDVYSLLKRNFLSLPGRSKRILPFMITQNWLGAYANTDELKRVFYGMDRRTSNISGMRNAVDQLLANYDELKNHFVEFYPQLQEYVESEIQILNED
jgi:acyl carrier protein phosphodiesterase